MQTPGQFRCVSSSSSGNESSSASESDSSDVEWDSSESASLILKSALTFVPQHGWSKRSLALGAEKAGFQGVTHGMFERGEIELVEFFYRLSNEQLRGSLAQMKDEKKRTDEFIYEALSTRLKMITPYIDSWPEAMALMARPSNIQNSLANLSKLVDDVWYYAGDRSTMFDWYTKRASLAAVYGTTQLYMIQDDSQDYNKTWSFLGYQLSMLEQAGKCSKKCQSLSKDARNLLWGAVNVALIKPCCYEWLNSFGIDFGCDTNKIVLEPEIVVQRTANFQPSLLRCTVTVSYVGNLDASVTEELLVTLFGQLGSCKGCKLIHEAGNDLYAFVEFSEHRDAQLALLAMNKRIVLGREMKVNWATSPGSTSKMDTSKHFHVFVGDISPDIESHQLREAFAPFGVISDCKVIRDPQTHKSKGYGFVCFVNKEDAEMAIVGMNGQWLGGRPLRTNWATGKGLAGQRTTTQTNRRELDYDDVFNQTGPTNSTVYCGGILGDLTEELMREHFGQFGTVQDIRVFKDKGFAFVRMDTKDSATRAIIATHGSQIGGYSVKSSWGKDMAAEGANSNSQQAPGSGAPARPPMPPQQPYYGGNAPYYNYWGGYGMPGGYGQPAAPYGMPYYGGYPQYGSGMPQMQWPGGPAPPAGPPPNGNQGQPQTNNGQ